MSIPTLRPYLDTAPQLGEHCYIDPVCAVIGDVVLGDDASVWPFAVIRGDVNRIRIGRASNVQDHAMLHVSHKTEAKPDGSPLTIGDEVTIGHHVTLHGCTIGNRVLVGINTVILDDAVIEDEVMIGAGSLVPPKKRLESGFLYVGSPVRQVRALTDAEKAFLSYSAAHYVRVKNNHLQSQGISGSAREA